MVPLAAVITALFVSGQTRHRISAGRVNAIGIKVGEVTQTSVIIWTRVSRPTEQPIRRKKDLRGFIESLLNSPPRLLVRLRYGTDQSPQRAADTGWRDTESENDHALSFPLDTLKPGTRYWFEVRAAHEDGTPLYGLRRGTFRTAPRANIARRVAFTVITGQAYHHLDDPTGFRIYESMPRIQPDFLVATGDSVYYDRGPLAVRTKEAAREHWRRTYQLPRLWKFHAVVPTYFEKDDHDVFGNDFWPGKREKGRGEFTYETGLEVFREQNPVPETPYRTIRWGRTAQIWLTEVREFRSPNDARDGPSKTIWGEQQKRWLKTTLEASNADWRILVNPTPIVGPDRAQKGDNHANKAFAFEGDATRKWLAGLGKNLILITGDRHWQYHSVDPQTGLEEYGCGPASDAHAGGSPGFDRLYHRFHRVGGGFLSVTVEPKGADSSIAIRYHDVDGEVVYEQVQSSLDADG